MNTDILIRIAREVFDLNEDEFFSHTRNGGKRTPAMARSIVAKMMYPKFTQSEIGEKLGGFDRTSVIYMIQNANNFIEIDEDIKSKYEQIKKEYVSEEAACREVGV